MSNKSNQPLEFRRLFLLADLYIDCWDASRGGLHSGLGTAYVGEGKGMGGFSIHEFWKGAISDALGQNRSVHEIAGLINKDFKRLVSDHEFEILSEEYALDIRDRQPNGKGTFEAREFREKLYGHYIRYLQDCIDYQEGEGFRDWSRLAEYLFHPNPVVGDSIRLLEPNAPKHEEHVVPLRYINNRAIMWLKEGSSAKDLRDFLDNALKIVIIHKEEHKKIDFELGWKDDMPPDWNIGGSFYDRLNKAGVKFVLRTPAKEIGSHEGNSKEIEGNRVRLDFQ